jgi:Cd2+/Zn2+-exporting ATPase
LQALGYGLADTDSNKSNVKPRNAILGFIVYLAEQYETRLALLGMAIMLATALAGLIIPFDISTPSNIIYTLATLIAVYPIAKSGIRTFFINRDFNINLLMTIAAFGAILIGEYFEGAAVIILFAIGEALEGYTADRARDSLRQLLSLAPSRAIRLMGDLQEDVPVEALTIGDRILVKPGERIPMDGVIVSGESGVNQAPITGESIPVH